MDYHKEPSRALFNMEQDYNNIEHNKQSNDVERTIMERGGMFNMDTYNYKDRMAGERQSSNGFKQGEITGQTYDNSELDHGMPARGFLDKHQHKVQDIEEQQNTYNPFLDFDLYQSEAKLDVTYHDPSLNSQEMNTGFADLNTPSENTQIEPMKELSVIINFFSWVFLDKLHDVLQNKNDVTIISPLSILTSIIYLYRGSNGLTESEIKEAFGFPNKDESFNALSNLCNNVFISKYVTGSNIIFVPNTYPLNNSFIDYAKNLGMMVPYDKNRPLPEINKINLLVHEFSKNTVSKIAKSNLININTNLILTSTTYFHGSFKNPFSKKKTKPLTFVSQNNVKRKINMMVHRNQVFNYYEDSMNQIIELDYDDDKFSFGIILPKNNNTLSFSHEQFEFYISQLRSTHIDILSVPKFEHQSQFKINNLFKTMGLTNMFTDADFSEISSSNNNIYVSDIIHNSTIIIDEGDQNNLQKYKQLSTTPTKHNNFIADHPFTYYIRYKPVTTLLMLGYFY